MQARGQVKNCDLLSQKPGEGASPGHEALMLPGRGGRGDPQSGWLGFLSLLSLPA